MLAIVTGQAARALGPERLPPTCAGPSVTDPPAASGPPGVAPASTIDPDDVQAFYR